MTSPVLLVVDDDAEALATLVQALQKRYGGDYRVVAERSPGAALQLLERLGSQGKPVALVMADQWMPDSTVALSRNVPGKPSNVEALLHGRASRRGMT